MENEMGRMALKMAKPNGVNLAIRSIDQGAELLNDPRSQDISIFVIVKTIADALRLAEKTNCIKHVNIGGIRKREGGKLIAAAVYVNDADIANLKKLKTLVDKVEFRMVPSDSAKQLDDVLSNY
jgi:mannose/fructose/N-acetylgalactosamine-specific phosphotransferase system component IIB